MILFDRTQRSTVAVCARCSWRDVFTDHAIALRVAAEHERGHSIDDAAKIRERHARVVANRAQRGRSA